MNDNFTTAEALSQKLIDDIRDKKILLVDVVYSTTSNPLSCHGDFIINNPTREVRLEITFLEKA